MPPRNFDTTVGGTQHLRAFSGGLADAVRQEHRSRCPCCGSPMVFHPRRRNPVNLYRRDRATVAHDVPVSMGGTPSIWVYACRGCNQDQGVLSFQNWGLTLQRTGDRRAEAVLILAAFVRDWRRAKRVRATVGGAEDADVSA